jgi:hypothetical protein
MRDLIRFGLRNDPYAAIAFAAIAGLIVALAGVLP